MALFPSEEWFREMEKILASDEEYKKAGAEWDDDVIMVIEKEPGKLEEDFIWYSKSKGGEILESGPLKSIDEKNAAYVISGPYSAWKAIVTREMDAMQAMLRGKIRVKGDMQKLLRFTKYQQLGMKALQQVETSFPDE